MLHQATNQPCFYCQASLDSECIHYGCDEDYIDFHKSCASRFIQDVHFALASLYAELSEVKTLEEAPDYREDY